MNMSRHAFYVFVFFFLHEFINVYIYDLYFDAIDDDDDDEEHIGDFDTFSPGYSQYLAFSFGGFGRLGNKG